MQQGETTAAMATALTFVLYTRRSETLSTCCKDTVPPPTGRALNIHYWSVVLHPVEDETPSKTGEFDKSVVVNNPEFPWVGPMLTRLKRGRAGTQPLLDL
eukprot:3989490-Heterocapsa_arctica.AAC.1